jgi:hypothetical protein
LTKLKVGLLHPCVVTVVHKLFTCLKLWPNVIQPQHAVNIVDAAPSALSIAAASASPTQQQLRLDGAAGLRSEPLVERQQLKLVP